MKKLPCLLICFGLLFFAACKKKSSEPAVNTTRVGNIYDDSSRTSTLYYYSPTQLIKGDYDDSGKYACIYHYLDGQSIAEVQLNGAPAYSIYYIWNSKSLADSSNTLNANGGLGMRKKYTYDGNNYLTGVKWYNGVNALVLTESFTITNGNITEHDYNVIDTTADLPRGTYSYQYYTDEINTLSSVYLGQAYLGTSSTNTVKSVSYTYGANTTTTNYYYNYSDGLIMSQLVFADSSGISTLMVDSISYSYYIQ